MKNLNKLNEHEGVQEFMPEYLWQFKGEQPGPTVTIMGGLHGDETVGIDVVGQLLRVVRDKIRAGIVNVCIGNPEACEQGKRFIDKDANRLWGHNLIDIPEQYRVEELKPFVAQSNILLDIHSTIKEVKNPFLVVPSLKHELIGTIATLGIEEIITGDGLKQPDGEPIESDLFTVANGGLGVTLEAGWQKKDNLVDDTMDSVLRALEDLGIFEKDSLGRHNSRCIPKTFKVWHAYEAIFAKENFRFFPAGKEWQNFELIEEGTLIGYQGNIPVFAERDSRILFPKSNNQIVPGERVCILLDKDMRIVDKERLTVF